MVTIATMMAVMKMTGKMKINKKITNKKKFNSKTQKEMIRSTD